MMSRKEYKKNTGKTETSSLRIHLCASDFCFNSFTVKRVNFFTINVKFKVILSSKSGGGGIFVQAIPPPPPPQDLRQWRSTSNIRRRIV